MRHSDVEGVRRVLDCIEAIDRAQATARRHSGDLDVGQLALDAVRHRLFMMGEAIRSLSLDMREDHPAVAWSQVARMPDLLGGYENNSDPATARAAMGEPLERLRAACRAILAESVRGGEDDP